MRNPPPLERPVQLARLTLPPGTVVRSHRHVQVHELVLITAGALRTTQDAASDTNGPGTLNFHPAGIAHEEAVQGAKPCQLLYASWRADPSIDAHAYPRVAADPTGRMRMLYEWMLALDGTVPAQRETRTALLHALVAAFVGAPVRGGDDDLLLAVRGYIAEHLAEPVRLADLARATGMSKYHFLRVFHRVAGATPMAYVRAMRVEAACAALAASDLPLRLIAAQVGFADPTALTRACRHVTGQTPRALRAGHAVR